MDCSITSDGPDISDEEFKKIRSDHYQSAIYLMNKIAKGTLKITENLKNLGEDMEKSEEIMVMLLEKTNDLK